MTCPTRNEKEKESHQEEKRWKKEKETLIFFANPRNCGGLNFMINFTYEIHTPAG